MNNVELLNSLYDARGELTRLISFTSATDASSALTLKQLIQQRDSITATIQELIATDLTATVTQFQQACNAIDGQTAELKTLKATLDDVKTAIGIAAQIVSVASSVLTAVATG